MKSVLAPILGALLVALAAVSGHAAEGRKPVPASRSEAAGAEQLRKQALRGNARAQTELGFRYATGHGVPQNRDQAFYWYSRAAEQGDPDGQYLLGLAYDKGHGVTSDAVRAYMWLNLAAARSTRRATYYTRIRDAVASKLTLAQLERGQWLATQWRPVASRARAVAP